MPRRASALLALSVEGERYRQQQEGDCCHVGQEPGAAEHRGVPVDGPEAEEDRRQQRDAEIIRQPADHPPR
jgi:hypothetical protein